MTVDFDRLASAISPDRLARVLGAEKVSGGWRWPLPENHSNGDRNPSFTTNRREGRTVAYCHGCGLSGSPVQVAAEVWGVGRQEAASRLAREAGIPSSPGGNGTGRSSRKEEVESYDYVDEQGELLFQVVRFEPKTFRQRRPDGRSG